MLRKSQASDTHDSIAWLSASSPVCAVNSADIVVSNSGSVTEISGTSARPPIVALKRRLVSVTTQNCDTSDPEPPVVGTITIGGIGLLAWSMPSYSRMCPPFPLRIATALARSMQLPPPIASSASQPLSR